MTKRGGLGLGLGALMVVVGCGGSRAEAQSAPSGGYAEPAPRPGGAGADGGAVRYDVAVPDGDGTEKREALGEGTVVGAAPQAPLLDIEAEFRIETKDVKSGSRLLMEITKAHGGQVVQESSSTTEYSAPQADLSLRVPVGQAERFFAALEKVGSIRSRNVRTRDVGKEYFDAELRLHNLELSRKRYEELLGQARTVEEIMSVERQLEDVRSRIESLKGELRWLRDRTAQATIQVTLFAPADEVSPYEEPEATFYPGLRLSYAHSMGGSYGASDFLGAGLSVRFSRHFSVDVEGLPTVNSGYGGEDIDLFLATAGGELYSEFLGDGKRRFLNPYLGARAGYARFLGLDQFAVGAVLGVELYKTPVFTLDLETRGYVLFAYQQEAHALVQPGLSFNVAF